MGAGVDVLSEEQAQLELARHCLELMRDSAGAIADYGVDALASQALGRLRAQRLSSLSADPDAPPFFGRTDRDDTGPGATGRRVTDSAGANTDRVDEQAPAWPVATVGTGAPTPRAGDEALHIGRRHVRDDELNPIVIDWRAPIARPFYRATPADRMGVTLRRRFGFSAGRLSSYEDEHLDLGERLGLDSRILRQEIERPRVGPMRDIVSTIQPDQDELVRADLDTSLCVQGSPGTGKTAVGLHRAAFLLYTYPQRLRRTGVLVVGPNAVFLDYIAQVLPALGEGGIAQATVDDLVAHAVVRAVDPVERAVLKGDARLAEVLRRAVQSHIAKPVEDVVAVIGTKRYRVAAHHVRRYVDDARRELAAGELRWNAARDRLRLQVAEDVRRQREAVGGAPTDAETRKLAASGPVRQAVDAVWPALRATALLARLYTDAAFLARCAPALDDTERALLSWSGGTSTRALPWTGADCVLLDELTGVLDGVDSYVHVVVDEAQDLSAMQCRAVARRSQLGSLTVLGDLAQATTAWAPGSWPATLTHLGKPAARIEPLTIGYRVPGEVLAVANRLLAHIHPDLLPASSVRQGEHEIAYAAWTDLGDVVRAALAFDGSVALIVADGDADRVSRVLGDAELSRGRLGGDERLVVVEAAQAKGLEFDSVIVVEPGHIVDAEIDRINGLRRLYVVLTRAVSRLYVVHDDPLPDELRARS